MISAEALAAVLDPPAVVEALRAAFRAPIETPLRHHHTIARLAGEQATLLLMPAWQMADPIAGSGFIGIKIVSVFPGNAARGRASVNGLYLLLSGETGEPVAVLDGRSLTLWRTAAASALAASHLARPDASRLVMVGAGALCEHLIRAHAAVRPIRHVAIWNRDPGKAVRAAAHVAALLPQVRIDPVEDLEAAVRAADVISAATLSSNPLVAGAWLQPGAHVDLVGGFTPDMREADDEAVRRASVFVDTRAGACHEAGDIVQPIARGVLRAEDVRADLFDLCRGLHTGRQSPEEITLFKSVGTALEDLAAAVLVAERA